MIALAVRQCRCCGQEKSDSDFYASQRSKCKECVKEAVRANRAANQEYYRTYERGRNQLPHRVSARLVYQQTVAFRDSHAKAVQKWDSSNPERRRAQWAVSNAVRDGKLLKEPCACCGAIEVEAHHPDYSSPLSVVWLCVPHHKQLHEEHAIFFGR